MGDETAVNAQLTNRGLGIALAMFAAVSGGFAQSSRPAAQTQPTGNALPKLPPRRAIAGIEVLETKSSVLEVAGAGLRKELIVTFAFPGRARLLETTQTANGVERRFRYRYGDTLFQHDLEAPASIELAGTARKEALAEIELRRALLLWPDGFEWTTNGETRTSSAGDIGTILAHLAAGAKQPDRITLVAEDGTERLSFRSIHWGETAGRFWPTRLELWRADKHATVETIEAPELKRSYVDLFFVPVDRRDRATERDAMLGVVREQELPRFCARRVELTRSSTWPEARRQIEATLAEWSARLKERSLALDSGWTVEIDEAARPKALLVRLATIPDPAPEGFTTAALRQARVMFVGGLTDATVARLDELKRAVPAGASTQAPYLRFRPDGGPVLVVLPLSP